MAEQSVDLSPSNRFFTNSLIALASLVAFTFGSSRQEDAVKVTDQLLLEMGRAGHIALAPNMKYDSMVVLDLSRQAFVDFGYKLPPPLVEFLGEERRYNQGSLCIGLALLVFLLSLLEKF